jgi:hypothetical protein
VRLKHGPTRWHVCHESPLSHDQRFDKFNVRLGFCNALAQWTEDNESRKQELALVTGKTRPHLPTTKSRIGDGNLLEATKPVEDGDLNKDSVMPLSPPCTDAMPRNANEIVAASSDLDLVGSIEREESNLLEELVHLQPLLEFTKGSHALGVVVCSDKESMKVMCSAHSLLKLACLLGSKVG